MIDDSIPITYGHWTPCRHLACFEIFDLLCIPICNNYKFSTVNKKCGFTIILVNSNKQYDTLAKARKLMLT